ncbi:MAG: DUF2281 domain-containing protein [Candidatus Aminicenantes bacterium]|nr:DUF2281 domain-containing protein [Candidatus Aminicenantes bacterium]
MINVQEYKSKINNIIEHLPESKVEELWDFAAYLKARYTGKEESPVNEESLILQQESLKKIWDNPGEDIYEL